MSFFILENFKTNILYVFLDNEYYYCKLCTYLVLEPGTQILIRSIVCTHLQQTAVVALTTSIFIKDLYYREARTWEHNKVYNL